MVQFLQFFIPTTTRVSRGTLIFGKCSRSFSQLKNNTHDEWDQSKVSEREREREEEKVRLREKEKD